jgi:cytochrome c biogenesis protein CcmG/thiol:disulfide interchange protein DsbE
MKTKRFTYWIFIISILISSISIADSKSEKSPQFSLKNLAGKQVKISDYRGEVVLINFWATWCPPCLAEIPDLVKLKKEKADKQFEILGIVLSSKESSVRKIVSKEKINYPVLWGTNKVVEDFGGIPVIPRTFLLDKDGKIVEDILGMRNYDFFKKLLDKYLK